MQNQRFSVIRRWAGDAERWLTAFLDSAPYDKSIVAIVVMGSAVRERGHRRSDFDLLLIYRGKRPSIRAPLEVDIRFLASERANELVEQGHEVLCWALKFGTALYDPELFWQRLVQSWSKRIPLPSPDDAQERGEECLTRAIEMLKIGDESAADDLVLSALTQFARERLIGRGVFPASRPELPDQLRKLNKDDSLADLLDAAMFDDVCPRDLVERLKGLNTRDGQVRRLRRGKSSVATSVGGEPKTHRARRRNRHT